MMAADMLPVGGTARRTVRQKIVAKATPTPTPVQPAEAPADKAQWTDAQVNDLPDSAFLYIQPGGSKDDSGSTVPRSLRHFPYRGADGEVDLPHLRNAIARIPQAQLPELGSTEAEALQAKARKLLADTQQERGVAKAVSGGLPSIKSPDPAFLASRLAAGHAAGVLVPGVRKSLRHGQEQFLTGDRPGARIHAIVSMGPAVDLPTGAAGMPPELRASISKADADAMGQEDGVAYRPLRLVDLPDEPVPLVQPPAGHVYGAEVDLGVHVATPGAGDEWRDALLAKAVEAGAAVEPGERLGDMTLREFVYGGL